MTTIETKKAILIGVQLPRVSDEETQGSLAELSRLVTTLGYQVVSQTSQKRKSEKGAVVLGDGKLSQVAKWTGGTGVIGPLVVKKKHKAALKFENAEDPEDASDEPEEQDASSLLDAATERDFATPVDDDEELGDEPIPSEKAEIAIFDCDLSPSQLRNLESALGVPVLDRTGVIIEIFSRHARTRAARLQVEIARLAYVAPRLRETGGGEDRGGGGVGGKGAGETSLELDKRRIRDRIKELKAELGSIAVEQDNRRQQRDQEITVALVGYTNAGKSSLMRALTGSQVLVADKLFATLDTTIRLLHPETRPKILISDTVGFIKKLPHDLVASFKSTLDEASHAKLLLYVVDSSDPTFRSQLDVTRSVLAEVGAQEVPSLLVLNKVDRLSPQDRQALEQEYPEAVFLSAHNPDDVAELRLRLVERFEIDMTDAEILVPYDRKGAIGEIRSKMRVIGESYDEKGVTLKVRAHAASVDRIKSRFELG